jgi:hypothetical protein
MILVKKTLFYFTLFLVCALLLLVGIAGHLAVMKGEFLEILQAKFHAETVIFISILSVVCAAVFFLIMVRRSVQVFRELDKIARLSRQGRYYSGDYMKRLGKLGGRIDNLFFELNRLNDAKSRKIFVQSRINRFLLDHCELRLLIIDLQGMVQHCSRRFAEQFNLRMDEIAGKRITEIVEGLRFDELVREAERRREGISAGKVTVKMGDQNYQAVLDLFPVLTDKNDLENFICTAEKEGILSEVPQRAEQVQAQVSRARRRFSDMFKKKRKK